MRICKHSRAEMVVNTDVENALGIMLNLQGGKRFA